jgi:hypothetical protein
MQSQFALLPFFTCSVKGFFEKSVRFFPSPITLASAPGTISRYYIQPLPEQVDEGLAALEGGDLLYF